MQPDVRTCLRWTWGISTRDLLDRGCRCCPSELRSRAPGSEAFEPGNQMMATWMTGSRHSGPSILRRACWLGIRLWTGCGWTKILDSATRQTSRNVISGPFVICMIWLHLPNLQRRSKSGIETDSGSNSEERVSDIDTEREQLKLLLSAENAVTFSVGVDLGALSQIPLENNYICVKQNIFLVAITKWWSPATICIILYTISHTYTRVHWHTNVLIYT